MLLALLLLWVAGSAAAAPVCDAVWTDAARKRDVPVRIYMPAGGQRPAPVILWSPGLGGGAASGAAWARGWSRGGFAVVAMAHPGTDASVYMGIKSAEDRRARTLAAIAPAQQQARIGDVGFVLDRLAAGGAEGDCDLAGLDLTRVAIAGHSMGAWTAQALAGERFGGKAAARDGRIVAALLMSSTGPPAPEASAAFGAIDIPVMVVTGSRDGVPPEAPLLVAAKILAERRAPYEGMPADGRKYFLAIPDADHMMFDGRTLGPKASPLALHVQAVVAALSRQFFAAWLSRDAAAAAVLALSHPAPLAADDIYVHK